VTARMHSCGLRNATTAQLHAPNGRAALVYVLVLLMCRVMVYANTDVASSDNPMYHDAEGKVWVCLELKAP
jgi:hypothetical protein